jgi:hypothetical protein
MVLLFILKKYSFLLNSKFEKSPPFINLQTYKSIPTNSAKIPSRNTRFCSSISPHDMGAILGASDTKYLM